MHAREMQKLREMYRPMRPPSEEEGDKIKDMETNAKTGSSSRSSLVVEQLITNLSCAAHFANGKKKMNDRWGKLESQEIETEKSERIRGGRRLP